LFSVCQLKGARALLGWSAEDLAEITGIGATTIRRYEMGSGIPNANVSVLKKLRACFEDHGIEFTGDPLVNPGVTLHISKDV